jgi:GDP-L-fucose synthase
MDYNSKIYVAGHAGMVGSALLRKLISMGYQNIITKTSKDLNLIIQAEVNEFFEKERPEYVFLAAAKVGGIHANSTYPAEFMYNNLMIQTNVIHSSYKYGVKKLMFLGSSCIYPKMAQQPIKEEYLLGGYLESTNEAYALAKISGLKMCEFYNRQYGTDFISVMPTNLYGPQDNYNLDTSHVLPALIRKFHEAKIKNEKTVTIWGTGTPMREFLHVDDLADACLYLMLNYSGNQTVNIGVGKDISILELAHLIKDIVCFEGTIAYDSTKPDGTFKKLLDVSKLHNMGWYPRISLQKGLKQVYIDFQREYTYN